MRLFTRTFLLWFTPFAALLLGSFGALRFLAERAVRQQMRASLAETNARAAALQARRDAESSRFLRMAAGSAELRAGMQLALVERSAAARATLEDQLREIGESLGIAAIAVRGPGGARLAEWPPARADGSEEMPAEGIWKGPGGLYRLTSAPVNQGNENLGSVTVGQPFDLAEFLTPSVVMRRGAVVASNVAGLDPAALSAGLAKCLASGECEVKLAGNAYLSLSLMPATGESGYAVRSLSNVDTAMAPMEAVLKDVFTGAAAASVLAGLLVGAFSSRALNRPIQELMNRLLAAEATGLLQDLPETPGQIRELRALTRGFNRAAAAARDAQGRLLKAYVEFVASLCSALDARDVYTAGHSRRVSEYATAVAEALRLSEGEKETIRVGGLLHDIGKIGISDTVLLKAGRLTAEERAIIERHPTIGRKILERIGGFERYVPVVELHHENWDGTGYPFKLQGADVDVGPRIVHVVDAFDAMTTSRPYRQCMGVERALRILRECAGSQFDPDIVSVFAQLVESGVVKTPAAARYDPESVANLARATQGANTPAESKPEARVENETEAVPQTTAEGQPI